MAIYSTDNSVWGNYVTGGTAGYYTNDYETIIENCTIAPRYDGEGATIQGKVTYKNCNFISSNVANNYVTGWDYSPTNYTTKYTIAGTDYGTGGNVYGVQGIYNTGVTYNIVSNGGWFSNLSPEEAKKQQQKSKLKSNLIIHIKSRVETPQAIPENEKVAMETLREEITEAEFRKYVKYGFILVKGQSGDTFQIFKNRSHTRVWRAGKIIEEVCVRIKYEEGAPPTDNVIAFRTIIQSDENAFKKLGNVFKMNGEGRAVIQGILANAA